MTYEEKYKRAFEIAKEVYHDDRKDKIWREWLTKPFPELKESEEERIRKGLINGFKECLEDCQYPKNAVKYWHNVEVDNILAWLEKQGEQKSSDFSDIRTWKYIVDMVLTEKDGIGNYLDNPDTERIAKRLQERQGNIEKQGEQKPIDNKERLGLLNFIRKETGCGLADANNALLKLIKVLKQRPLLIMDKPHKLKIEWEKQQGKND